LTNQKLASNENQDASLRGLRVERGDAVSDFLEWKALDLISVLPAQQVPGPSSSYRQLLGNRFRTKDGSRLEREHRMLPLFQC
jgi:hypothetical protein